MKRWMRPVLWICLLAACAVMQAQSSTQRGVVENQQGSPVGNAFVSVSLGGSPVAHVYTDNAGRFSFTGLDASYQVTVSAFRYTSVHLASTNFSAASAPSLLHLGPLAACAYGRLRGKCFEPHKWDETPWEYGVFIQGGNGLEDRTDYHFFSAGVYAGKVLTHGFGPGMYKANFEYGVEVLPLWQSYTPKFQRINCPYNATSASQCSGPTTTGGTYRGFSIVPIILRVNFRHGAKFEPWFQGAGGLVYTTRKYPAIGSTNYLDPSQTAPNADTSVWNFDPQFGIGVHYFPRDTRHSVDFSANAVHISSSSLGDKNPGVNTGVQFTLGYTWWK